MTRLREIIEYVAARSNWIAPFSELRDRFNGDLTGLKPALERGLLELRFDCYFLTKAGRAFLKQTTLSKPELKVCYQCQRILPAEQFWKATSSGDGLFPYCIACANRKKRKAMELRRKIAEDAITEASTKLVAAARLWDQAVGDLASAWEQIMLADQVIREHMRDLEIENDSGRMHARPTFIHAAYALNIALTDVKYPQTAPLLRELNFPAKLAEYIGTDPHLDYLIPGSGIIVQRKKRKNGKTA